MPKTAAEWNIVREMILPALDHFPAPQPERQALTRALASLVDTCEQMEQREEESKQALARERDKRQVADSLVNRATHLLIEAAMTISAYERATSQFAALAEGDADGLVSKGEMRAVLIELGVKPRV